MPWASGGTRNCRVSRPSLRHRATGVDDRREGLVAGDGISINLRAILNETQQRVAFFAGTQDQSGFTCQIAFGQRMFDIADRPIVNVRTALPDQTARFAFAFGEPHMNKRIDYLHTFQLVAR